MTWKQLTERDCREWKLSAIDPHDRDTWRSSVRSAMRAASQLPGRGPTVVDMARTLIKNPMMMMWLKHFFIIFSSLCFVLCYFVWPETSKSET